MEKKKSLKNIWQNPPQINNIDPWTIPQPRRLYLDNRIPVDCVHKEGLEFFSLDIVWHAGRSYEENKLMGKVVASLIKEGSSKISGDELDELVDLYGANLSSKSGMDFNRISLLGMRKFFDPLCGAISQLLGEPQFANKEIKNLIRRNKERLRVDLVNADIVAYRTLTEQIYGKDHPYGYNSDPKMYKGIERDNILKHYTTCYKLADAHIFLSTHIDDGILETLNRCFGSEGKRSSVPPKSNYWEPQLPSGNATKVILDHPHQSMIQMGRKLFNRAHDDFYKVYMASTILGGYFGSRLMKNIREEKGYTYNIFTSLDSTMNSGYFSISTEVSHENIEKVVNLIEVELDKMRSEVVPQKELQMVKNYLLGYSLNMLDGPFNIMEMIRMFMMQTGDITSYSKMMDTIQHITSGEIQEIAHRYFQSDEMMTVIVT